MVPGELFDRSRSSGSAHFEAQVRIARPVPGRDRQPKSIFDPAERFVRNRIQPDPANPGRSCVKDMARFFFHQTVEGYAG